MTAIWSRGFPERFCSRCSSPGSICAGIISLDRSSSPWLPPVVRSSPSTASDCSRMPRAVITWLTAWLPHPPGARFWPMERSSFCWERRSGTSGSTAGAHRRPHLFSRTPLRLSGKDERKVSDAPHWWRCADRDGLSRLSLSPDHYPAAAALTPGRDGPRQFSQPQHRPRLHRGGHLLRGGAGVGGLVLVRPGAPDS